MKDRDFAFEQLKSISIICIFSFCFFAMFYLKYFEDIIMFKKILLSVIISFLGMAGGLTIFFCVVSLCMSLFEKSKCDMALLDVKKSNDVSEIHVLNSCVISNKDFACFTNLEKIVLNNPDIQLKEETFFGLTNLKNVELPANLSVLEKNLFLNCSSLESLELPKNIKSIKKHCFYNCNSLKKIIFLGNHRDWKKLMVQCWKNDLPVGCLVMENGNVWKLNDNYIFKKSAGERK